MDAHRPHDFIGNSNERSRSMYCNTRESQDVANHTHYYSQDRSILSVDSNKLCQCLEGLSEGLNCKGCHAISSVEKPWKAKNQLCVDYKSLQIGKSSNKSHMYIHPDGGEVPYWSQHVSSFSEDSTIANKPISRPSPNIDRRACGKVCVPDRINYKTLSQPPMQLQQELRSQQPGGFCKGRFCDEKNSYQHETRNITTVYAVSGSAPNFLHCEPGPTNDELSEPTIDHRIINPMNTKMLFSDEQHQSPIYTRKCPKLCSIEEQNTRYSNLFMTTPQFSSEKFASIYPEKNVDYISRSTTTGEMHISNESQNLCENSISPKSSPISTIYTHKNKFQTMQKEHMHPYLPQPQQMQQKTLYCKMTATSGRPDHYFNSHSTHKDPSLSKETSNMGTESFDQYQFSENPAALSSADLIQKEMTQTLPSSEYTDQEGMAFDVRGIAPGNRTGLFHNPYNPSHASNNCCNETAIVPSNVSNDRRESSHEYQKYGKSMEEVDSSNKLVPLSQYSSTKGSSILENIITHPYCYETVQTKCINKLPYSQTSSPVATVSGVPTSPILRTSQTHHKMHHIQYFPQYIQSYKSHQQAEDFQSQSVNANKAPIECSDLCESQTSSSQITCYSRSHQRSAQTTVISPIVFGAAPSAISSTVMQAPNQKKSHIPKPNYRDLINKAYARRNATSEKELNIQIIKKTLNIDTHATKALSDVSKINDSLSMFNNQAIKNKSSEQRPDLINRQEIFSNSACNLQNPPRTEILSLEPMTKVHNATQLTENGSSSPLDLSMRTVKTKADSTNCKYHLMPNVTQNNQNNCSFTLPRVNFTPNFSFPTNFDETINIGLNRPKSNEPSTIDFVNPTSSVKPKVDHVQTYSKSASSEEYFFSPVLASDINPCITTEMKTTSFPHKKQLPLHQFGDLQPLQDSLIIKSASKQTLRGCMEARKMRHSVLETNPYSSFRETTNESTSSSAETRTFLSINQLPPDTSIMPLIKTAASDTSALSNMISKSRETLPSKSSPLLRDCEALETLPYINSMENNKTIHSASATELSSNAVFCRKRILHEFEEPLPKKLWIKEPKLEEPSSLELENIHQAKVPVIAVNERHVDIEESRTAEKSIQAEIQCFKQKFNAENICMNDNNSTLKNEPISPTQQGTQYFSPQLKSDSSSLIAARIRTKAELKGFTYIPPILKHNEILLQEPMRIKEEPRRSPNSAIACIPELKDDYKQENLLDNSWNKACNSFVQQLLSNQKKRTLIKKQKADKDEQSDDEIPCEVSKNPQIEGLYNNKVDFNIRKASRDSKAVDNRSEIQSSNFEAIIPSPILQKKVSKLGRDELRMQQEKRFVARLQNESSSETDNELDRRKSDRLKKPFKKNKARQSTQTAKNRFSDCGSDSSGTDSNQIKKYQLEKTIDNSKTVKNITPKQNVIIKHSRNNILDRKCTVSATQVNPNSKESGVLLKQKQKEQQNACALQNKSEQNVIEKNPNNEKVTLQGNENTKQRPNVKKLQCENKEKLKDNNKEKISLRVGHNTITRSKRKKELELQLANSKVLRNDKIIRNPTTTIKIKRKYVRKFSSVNNQSNTNKNPFNKDVQNHLIMSTRLRLRKDKDSAKDRGKQVKLNRKGYAEKGNSTLKSSNNRQSNILLNEEKETSSFKSSNDRQSDILMEVYRYKRSLKIPPSLITIKHPSNDKLSTTVPDLENHNNSESTSTPLKLAQVRKNNESTTKTVPTPPRSIIDVLHSRVINSTTPIILKPVSNNKQKVVFYESISKVKLSDNTSGFAVTTPSTQKHNDDSNKISKKRHFSIFDTKVLQSKTRTESKMQQKREIIREIFVGDERPASAPPEVTPATENDVKMTYEQKYEQFLQQMNIVVNEANFCKFAKSTPVSVANCFGQHHTYKKFTDTMIKREDDTESASAIDVDEKEDGENPLDVASAGPHLNNFKRRRCGKYFRRKGSSGFDYIRKKKKPPSIITNTSQQACAAKIDSKFEAYYATKEKTEDDLCREIQKWVLNKGVGQSSMHKAARLGYIDVIVYCLDRLCMNPDQKDNAGYTPLHEACSNGWLEIAKILLQYGAKHSETAHSGIRPLHEASENGHKEIVRLLLSYGADPLIATYSGQTPLMLASSPGVRDILRNHLLDVKYVGPDRRPWRFEGPWRIFDVAEGGYDVFSGAPNSSCDTSRALNRSFGSDAKQNTKQAVIKKYSTFFDNIDRLNSIRLESDFGTEVLMDTTTDSEDVLFEFEEADVLLPPLYLLKDEGAEKWVLLSDLCNLLKVKSKDTLLNKIYPSSSMSPTHRGIMRELKMSDFLEKATCMQLLSAGEKINLCASKVVLIKYNESVRNLLGVKTFFMKF